jgi:hypothetical protein
VSTSSTTPASGDLWYDYQQDAMKNSARKKLVMAFPSWAFIHNLSKIAPGKEINKSRINNKIAISIGTSLEFTRTKEATPPNRMAR